MARRVLMAEESGGRVRGRQRLGWMDDVKVALCHRVMTVDSARQCAKDRKEWSAQVYQGADVKYTGSGVYVDDCVCVCVWVIFFFLVREVNIKVHSQVHQITAKLKQILQLRATNSNITRLTI